MSLEHARSEIVRAFPELAVHEIQLLGSGMDSDAYLVNGEWVFRFPRRLAASRGLDREIALLPQLAEFLPVDVPRFEYIGEQAESGLRFVGYRLIPGEPLTPELFESLSQEAQEHVLETLSRFLDIVHAFPVHEARLADVESISTRSLVADNWDATRDRVLAQLSAADGQAVAAFIEGFLADPYNFSERPCLLYADFAPEHILYDRAADEITGIIDWGDMAIGDPDYDLTFLYQDYGAGFVRRLQVHYQHDQPDRLYRKLRAFCAYDYLFDIRANSDGSETVREALAGLRQLAREV
jgi:aminoglycoside 2''-phosphotransferase